VDERRESVAARMREVAALRTETQKSFDRLNEHARTALSADLLADRLRIATADADERSDRVAESFLAEGGDAVAFLREYLDARSLLHRRKVALDQYRRRRRNGDPFFKP